MKKLAKKLRDRLVDNVKEHKARWIVTSLLLLVIVVLLFQVPIKFKTEAEIIRQVDVDSSAKNPMQEHDNMPNEADFEKVAETDTLILKFDMISGHFIVEDKRNGNVWHSYPNPEYWENESIPGIWRQHLRSPVMIQTLDFERYNSRPRISNWISDNGIISNFEKIDGGVRLVYELTNSLVKIPVEITIKDDYLQTKIIDEGIEEGQFGLLWVRLFPFIGAHHSTGQEGYLLVPDGSGALISFNQTQRNQNKIYKESIYGTDYAFNTTESSRNTILMPIFGIKSGDRALLAVVEEGAEYMDIIGSPAGVYSDYNWAATEARYRSPFRQVTNRAMNRGFITYDEEHRFHADRTVRYYFLDTDEADYVGMAARYRQYLIEEKGFERIQNPSEDIPLYLTILGGDQEEGMFANRFVQTTTTSQAMEMVRKLHGLGINNMHINMLGWQKNGYNEFGRQMPIDRRLGGNDGMKEFIDYVHSLGFPVSYGVNFTINNSNAHGFIERYHGMRDLSGTVLRQRDWINNQLTLISHNYLDTYFEDRLAEIRALGFDGITFGGGYTYAPGLGSLLLSDYSDRYGADRTESIAIQQKFYEIASEMFDIVNSTTSFQYVNNYVDHIYALTDDYSYDLFSQEAVPFAQIALHGLVTYTSQYINEREEYTTQFLKDLEYGTVPSFIFTHEPTEALRFSYGLRLFSTEASGWENEAVQQYQIFNEVLGDVQDQFIVNHRKLANNVYETTYENGKRIIVNYSQTRSYVADGVTVEPRGYAVIGGAAQ